MKILEIFFIKKNKQFEFIEGKREDNIVENFGLGIGIEINFG